MSDPNNVEIRLDKSWERIGLPKDLEVTEKGNEFVTTVSSNDVPHIIEETCSLALKANQSVRFYVMGGRVPLEGSKKDKKHSHTQQTSGTGVSYAWAASPQFIMTMASSGFPRGMMKCPNCDGKGVIYK